RDHARVAERAAAAILRFAIDERDREAAAQAGKRHAQADDARADGENVLQLPNAPAVGIVAVEAPRGLAVHVGARGDHRHGAAALAIEPAIARAERAADKARLHPALAFAELAVGGEARELGARSGAARRAVVRLARTQHEVARARFAGNRCA